MMGVVNVSPDSKNTHTVARSVAEALLMADRYREWGATIIDVGGQSSHYENPAVPAEEEVARTAPVVEALVAEGHLVSIDTWKPEVAEAALRSGAVVVNDTGGLADPAMRDVAARSGAAAVAVRVEAASPREVGEIKIWDDPAGRAAEGFRSLLPELEADGVTNVVLDPGIAINYPGDYEAYTEMQLRMIAGADRLRALGKPVLIPIPRKRDAHRVAAFISLALEHRADIIRAHDAAMACDLARLFRRAG